MPATLLLSRQDLEAVLDFSSVLDALEDAFRAEHRGEWDTPKRVAARTAAGGLLAMPSAGGAPAALGAKLVSTFAGSPAFGLPSVAGLFALFDPEVGGPLAVMDGGYLTLVRTAGVSALATRVLSRPDATTLGVLGAGAQAEFHVRLIAMVRPIGRVIIWARQPEKAQALLASLRAREELRQVTSWVVAREAAEAAGCDVVATTTAATKPVLEGRWLSEGSHLNSIGAHTASTREIDTEAVTRASTLATETRDTLEEAGDLQMAQAEAGDIVGRVLTLGGLLDPRTPFARDPRAITLFKSCGVAFEDLAVAGLAFHRAREVNLGSRFQFS